MYLLDSVTMDNYHAPLIVLYALSHCLPHSFLFPILHIIIYYSVYQIAAARLLIVQLQCICVYGCAMVYDMVVTL